VFLRLAYLGVTNVFAMLRLLPMNDRAKDAEILALRHQITVLERQLRGQKVRFDPHDRAFPAALPHRLPHETLHRLRPPVHPDTLLRWHRDLTARHPAKTSHPTRPSRPRTLHSTGTPVRRMVRENPSWGYRRVHGELLAPGVKVAAGVTQLAKNLVMDLEDPGCQAKYLIRDRDGTFPDLFDTILADTGITVVRSGVRIPPMNSIMERWVPTCRRELLDRTLIRNQRHLLDALHEFEIFYNEHRPHQGISNARPLRALPEPITDPDNLVRLDVRRRDRLGGILHEYENAA
jgi:putative transposase